MIMDHRLENIDLIEWIKIDFEPKFCDAGEACTTPEGIIIQKRNTRKYCNDACRMSFHGSEAKHKGKRLKGGRDYLPVGMTDETKQQLKEHKKSTKYKENQFLKIQFLAIDGEGKDIPMDFEDSQYFKDMMEDYKAYQAYVDYTDARDLWEEFYEILTKNGKIRPYIAGKYKSDWADIPIWLRRKTGLFPDQMAEVFKNLYPHYGIVDENSLHEKIDKYLQFRKRKKVKLPPKLSKFYDRKISWAKDHIYTLLHCSDGSYIENQKGLQTEQIFEYLLSLRKTYKNTRKYVFVGFGLNYDINKWLHGMPVYFLEVLAETNKVMWKADNGKLYRIEWIPGKWFLLSEGKYNLSKNKWTSKRIIRIYDVFGFFQKSFVATLEDWEISEGYLDRIIDMKSKRGEFDHETPEDVRQYCFEECILLSELMTKFRNALAMAEIRLSMWHGAGAIAAYLLKEYNVKDHLEGHLFEDVEHAIMSAYFGGRIEVTRVGLFKDCYGHDINSAYPSVNVKLPSWKNVKLQKTKKFVDHSWSLYHVEWDLPKDIRICPFPYRLEHGSIQYLTNGQGWYWYPEVKAALQVFPENVRILEGYLFHPSTDYKPFAFIADKYRKRLEFKRNPDPQISSAQKPIKLGLNALYGKQAQNQTQRKPAYQSYINAGYITSETRARLFLAAQANPESVIMFATDGIFSTSKLVEHDQGKPLGGWEVDHIDEIFVIQAGVYRFRDNEEVKKVKTRGFKKDGLDLDHVQQVWIDNGMNWPYPNPCKAKRRSFIGLKWAAATGNWDLWGKWPEVEREMKPSVKGLVDNIFDGTYDKKPNYPVFANRFDVGEEIPDSCEFEKCGTETGNERSETDYIEKLIYLDNIDFELEDE